MKNSFFEEKSIEMSMAEGGLKTVSGKNMAVFEDGTPAIIVNQYGKGKGIYLNLDISDYAGMKGRGVAGEVIEEEKGKADYVAAVQDIFEKILASAGLKKRIEILENGKPVNAGERFYYAEGKNLYVAYMPEAVKETKVTVKVDKKLNVYDIRAKKYIGNTDTFEDTLKPGNVKVYSVLAYRVTGINGTLKSSYKQGENIELDVSIKTDTGTPDRHIFRIEVYRDGKNIQAYNRNIVAEKGRAKIIIPLAYNQEKGNYSLLVRDVNSGIDRMFHFKVI